MPVRIAPSILSADFARLGEEVRAIDAAGADWIHVDVMDGHFVPNLTIGPAVVKALRKHTGKAFDVHLMISPVDPFLAGFADAGADTISVHPEAGPHLHRTLQTIKGLGKRAGVVLNPATPVEAVDPIMDLIDLILVMSVNPGFGGQKFIESQLGKIASLRKRIDASGRAIDLEVDGGIDRATAPRAIAAGADVLVAGTASFEGGPARYAENIAALRGELSDDGFGSGADGVEEGKRLIRLGGDRGLSLADRIAERFQRMAWRTPLHSMRLKGRHPLKLIAVADDPFLGDIARGNALLDGIVQYRGEERAVTALDFAKANWSRPFGEHLHSFAWLRDLSSVATRAQGAPIAEAILQRWLAAHADKVADPAWRPDLWGRRILFWTAHAPLILSSQDLVYRSTVLHALARGARHLDRSADRAPLAPQRLAAWCGVLVAGLMIPGGDPRRAFGETGLKRTLDVLVTSDGGTIGRSPVGHLDCVMLLTMLCEAYAARRVEPPAFVQSALARMVAALLAVCHGDKGLSSWQGSVPVPGEVIAQVIEGTGVRTRPLRQAREWGYQRLAAAGTVLILDAAPPPARMIEGGCASTLAFELSEGMQRIVVNCGGSRMAHSAVPAALTEGLRTTAAHSTLVIGDSNSTAIHPDGTLGRGVAEVELSRQESDTASRIEASHDGYARRFGFIHRRQIALASDGRDIRGEDMLLPVGRRQRKKVATPFAVRFHLAPHIEVAPTADGMAAFLKCPGGVVWQFRCRGGALGVEDSVWLDGQGRPQSTVQLVIAAETPPGGTNVSWVFHRAK